MKVVIACDSFKGCLCSSAVNEAICAGIHQYDPDIKTDCLTIADGGEGTVAAFASALKAEITSEHTVDCFGKPICASMVQKGDIAVIEAASVTGLGNLRKEERDPWHAKSDGIGILLKNGYEKGYKNIILGLGGTCTNDGGMGMLRGLGMRFYDTNHTLLMDGAIDLSKVASIEEDAFLRFPTGTLSIACDVHNPLLGKQGATYTYGPQKGFSMREVEQAEEGMAHYASIMKRYGYSMDIVGGGAAGGIGAAALAVLGGTRHSGIELLLETADFAKRIQGADLIISGEGCTDEQSLYGKAVSGVAGYAKQADIPFILISGQLRKGYEAFYDRGMQSAYALVSLAENEQDAMIKAEEYLMCTAKIAIENFLRTKENERKMK